MRPLIALIVLLIPAAVFGQAFPGPVDVSQAGAPWHVVCDNCPSGLTDAELRATPVPVSVIGTVTFANTSLAVTQSGTWNVGTVTSITNPVAVTGTFWQATQPVSLASVPSHAVTNAGTFAVQVTSAPTTAVTGTFWQATQPVSLGSVPSHGVYPVSAPTPFSCGLQAIAASLTQCQAAASGGQSHYLTGLYVQTTTTTSGTYAVQSGTGTNCGTTTTPVFPVSGANNRFNAPITSNAMAAIAFNPPIKILANHAICLIGVATNTISAQMVGYTQ